MNALEGQTILDEANAGRTLASMVMQLGDRLRNENTPIAVREWFSENQPHAGHATPMLTIARRLAPNTRIADTGGANAIKANDQADPQTRSEA